jgi:hypothetical protein
MKDTTPVTRTSSFTDATSRHRVARALTIAISACVSVLLLARTGLAADAQFVSLGQGIAITGTPEGSIPYAGTLNVAIGPPFDGPLTEAYCIDMAQLINIGDIESEVTPNYPCQVVYILNNFYPNAASVLSPISREAAAVQSAIWSFTDGFVVTDPPDIVSRASDIIAAADASNCVPISVVPQSIMVTPSSAVNVFPPNYNHTVTATLIGSDGQPLANYPVTIDVTGASGSQSFPGTTNAAGQFTATYTNPGTAGTDTITAKASFNLPLGLEFSAPDTQSIVLAGEPDAGMVEGSAEKTWKAGFCGDGIIQPGLGEQCEPPSSLGCDANCHATEICTDLVDNDGDGQIDCLDTDCDCLPIGRDPGVIRFDPAGAKKDLIAVHGSLKPETPINPADETISFLLTNVNGKIFQLTIPAGDVKQLGRNRYRLRNRLAQQTRSGVAQFDLRHFPRRDNYTFALKAYGDLSLATEANMALQVVVGDDPFLNQSTWAKIPQGWALTLP